LSFELIAWVFLPEHFHLLINPYKGDISKFMQCFKLSFSMYYRNRSGSPKGPVWQKRYWDHVIRDDKDYAHHLNYIHINPVKHGLVKQAFDWPHSSIHKFKEYYPDDWGCKEDIELDGKYGE
jgi:putative transposase